MGSNLFSHLNGALRIKIIQKRIDGKGTSLKGTSIFCYLMVVFSLIFLCLYFPDETHFKNMFISSTSFVYRFDILHFITYSI